ncbi:MAG: thiol-disulfide isomerase [Bryobacteraceae bacterium]|nr:thiol-disulfide isomerase [Bryobacteraceae bacterium]
MLQKNCQGCHRPGEAAPMSLLSYKEARPWAKAIKQAVLNKRMPPWFADPAHGQFKNDRSLSKAEIDTLVAWADSGAKEGEPADAPKPVAFLEGWNIGKPDAVFEMPNKYEVPAEGTIEYQYIVIPTNFKEDKWVQMAEVRPGNRAVVHHVIAFIREPGSKWLKDAQPGVPFVPESKRPGAQRPQQQGQRNRSEDDGMGGEFLVGYAPGTVPEVLEPGRGKLIKAGSDIVFQMHYTANGKTQSDQTHLGLVFANEPVKERVMTLAVANNKFVIPPGDPAYRVDAKLPFHGEATLTGLLPHMHLRGKSFEYRLVREDGSREVLLNVPRYDFNWQLSYYPKQPIALKPGMVLEATAYFDNSANNPANPDPKAEVRYGDQSWEEMMFGFFDIAFDVHKNPADLLRAPKKRPAPMPSGE